MAEAEVIDVPKISCSSCPSRAVLREPQRAERLALVPTILHFLKQTVATPVPRSAVGGPQGFLPGQSSFSSAGRGRSGGLHGFLPRQGSSQRTGEQIVHTPVHGRGVTGSLQGSPQDRVSPKRTAEQIADIPVLGAVRSVSFPAVLPGEPEPLVFRTFPRNKKSAALAAHSSARVPAHSSSSTPGALCRGQCAPVARRLLGR